MAHQSSVTTISWSPEGDRLVSGAVDGNMVVWNLNAPREIHERRQIHPGGVFCVEWAGNNVVYSCGDDACVRETRLVMWCVCYKQRIHHPTSELLGENLQMLKDSPTRHLEAEVRYAWECREHQEWYPDSLLCSPAGDAWRLGEKIPKKRADGKVPKWMTGEMVLSSMTGEKVLDTTTEEKT